MKTDLQWCDAIERADSIIFCARVHGCDSSEHFMCNISLSKEAAFKLVGRLFPFLAFSTFSSESHTTMFIEEGF
jgi:hypothetical protein